MRVVNVATYGHTFGSGRLNLTRVLTPENYSGITAYFESKLANILHARELARRENEHLDGRKEMPKVVAVSLHPGVVSTDGPRHMPVFFQVRAELWMLFSAITFVKF